MWKYLVLQSRLIAFKTMLLFVGLSMGFPISKSLDEHQIGNHTPTQIQWNLEPDSDEPNEPHPSEPRSSNVATETPIHQALIKVLIFPFSSTGHFNSSFFRYSTGQAQAPPTQPATLI